MVESRFMESGSGGSDDEDEEVEDERLRRKLSSGGSPAAPSGGGSATEDPTEAFRDLQDAPTSGGGSTGGGSSSSASTSSDSGGDTVTDAEQQNIDAGFADVSQEVEDAQQGIEDDPDATTSTTTTDDGPTDPTPGRTTEAEQQDINAAVAEVNDRVAREQQGIEESGAGSNQLAARAMEFEQRVLEQNEFVDSRDEIRVVRDGDRLAAEFTALRAEGVGVNRSIQDVRQDVADETPGVDAEDIGVERKDRGVYTVSVPRDTGLEDDPNVPTGIQAAALDLEREVIENSDVVDERSDVRVVRDGAGGLVAELTPSGAEDAGLNRTTREVEADFAAATPGLQRGDVIATREGDGFSIALSPTATFDVGELDRDAQQDVNERLVGSLFATTRAEPLGPNEEVERTEQVLTGLNARTTLRQAEGAARRGEDIPVLGGLAADRPRDLGDTPIENPLTGNRVEDDLNSVRSDIGEEIDQFREFNAALGGYVASRAYGPDSADDTDVEAFGRAGLERTVTGFSTFPANLVQAPFDTASASKEVAETAGFLAAEQPALGFNARGEVVNFGGSGEDAVDRSTTVGQQAALFGASTAATARDRPIEFVATAAGETALGSIGAAGLRGATRRGRTLGRRAAREGRTELDTLTPRVELVRDPDAGLFDIDTEAFSLTRSRTSTGQTPLLGPAEGLVASANLGSRAALSRARSGVESAGDTLADARPGQRVVDEVSGTVAGARLSGEAALTNAQRRAAGALEAGGDRLANARPGQRLGTAVRNAEIAFDLGQRSARRRARQRVVSAGDTLADARPGRDLADQIAGAYLGYRLSFEAALGNARRGASARVQDIGDTLANARPGEALVAAAADREVGLSTGLLGLGDRLADASAPRPGRAILDEATRQADRVRSLQDLTIRVGPNPPSQRTNVLDVRGLDGVEVDLGPFADEDLGDLGGFDTGDTNTNRGDTGDARRVSGPQSGQQALLRPETELVDPQPRPNARTGTPSLGGALTPLFASGDTDAVAEPTVDTDTSGVVGGLTGPTTGLGVGSLGGTSLSQLGGVSLGLFGRTALGADLRTEVEADTRLDADARTDLRARRDAAAEFDRRRRLQLNLDQQPRQDNTPQLPSLGTPSPTPRGGAGDNEGQTAPSLPNGPGSSPSDEDDGMLNVGFLSETVTDIGAGGFATGISPGEAALEARAGPGVIDLPTAQLIEGDPGAQAALDLLGGGFGGGSTGSTNTNNNDDGELLGLPTL